MATIRGTNKRDVLKGTGSIDQLLGLGGNDDLFGLAGNDQLFGGNGNDRLFGGNGLDKLFGETGNDFLDGGKGPDQMRGGTGNDTYVVDNAADKVIEAANQGNDLVRSSISHVLTANVEKLTLTGAAAINGIGNTLNNVITGNAGVNSLNGGTGHDVLVGGAGGDTLIGGDGNDTLIPGPGNGVRDIISGGSGFDTVDYRDAAGPVQVLLALNNSANHAFRDIINEVESVVGSRFADLLSASTTLFSNAFGGDGNDMIQGSSAMYDRMRGDDGNDVLIGAVGEEDYWLQYDRGMDFLIGYRQSGQDHIIIVGSEFGLATNRGNSISPAEFGSGNVQGIPPFLGIQKLFYETTTQILWADKDGIGGSFAPVAVAILAQGSSAPTAADIFVI